MATPAPDAGTWTFLSNHAHVLICIGQQPDMRMRDIAARVGVTERAVQRIVADLETAEILERVREGRRNRYDINAEQHLRHPIEADCTVGILLDLIIEGRRRRQKTSKRKS